MACKEIIIEEVDENDIPSSQLSEFVEADEIPIVQEEEEIDFIGDSFDDSESEVDETIQKSLEQKSDTKKPQKVKKSKQKGNGPSEKLQSTLLRKFMNEEISYAEYASRMNEMTFDDAPEDDQSDDTEDDTVVKKIKTRSKQQTEKAETHHAKKSKRALSSALQGLMGEANLCFARGDAAMCEKLCLEIIRQEPMAGEPYITLSQIYENKDEQKYLHLLMLAAQLSSTSIQWIQVAEAFLDRGNLKQASYCYAKATRCDPKNLSIRMQRLEILEKLGDKKHFLHCTFCMLSFIPKEDHEFLIDRAEWVAKKYREEGLISKSLEAMLKVYQKVPEYFTAEKLNTLIELLINNKKYYKCLEILTTHTGLRFKVQQNDENKGVFEFTEINIPVEMVMDLRTKMVLCLIYLNALNLFPMLIRNVLEFIDVEKGGDCFLDIAEAMISKSNFGGALQLLNPLVKSKSFSIAAVWLKHADCLRALERYPEAIESYKKVVELSQHVDAMLTLAALLKHEGRMEEALEALTQDPQTETMSTELLKEKCLLLRDLERIDEYLHFGYIMLLRHCVHYRSRQEVQIVSNFTKTNDRLNELKNLRRNREEVIDDVDTPEFSKVDEPTVSDDWNFFCDLINVAWKHKKYVQLQRISFAGMSSRRLQSHVREIDFVGVIACLFNKEEVFGYNKIREFLSTDRDKPRFWNLFNLIVYVTQDSRYHRFVMRLFDRNTPYVTNVPPLVYTMIANYFLLSNSYKFALNHYDEIYKKFQNPMVALILSILYSQIANQKYTTRKQNLLVQSMQYMEKYKTTREPEAEAEVLYNTGRLYHQIGIISVAKDYYERALKVSNPLIEKYPDLLDLKMEIAYNLHIIYKQSGNNHMARKILYDHIVI